MADKEKRKFTYDYLNTDNKLIISEEEMADKEEKIRGELKIQINQFLWPSCKECGGKCKTEEVIKYCRDSQPGITRQEAIHKIGVALCAAEGNVDCEECIYRGTKMCETQLNNWYLKYAEVALDALLNN